MAGTQYSHGSQPNCASDIRHKSIPVSHLIQVAGFDGSGDGAAGKLEADDVLTGEGVEIEIGTVFHLGPHQFKPDGGPGCVSPVVPAMFAVVSQDIEPAVIVPSLTESHTSCKGIHRFRGFGGWTGFGHYLAAGDHGVQPGIVIEHHVVHVACKARHHRFDSSFHDILLWI